MANCNSVELLGHYGGDETHALSAWTSTSRDLPQEKRARIDKLLLMLFCDGSCPPEALHGHVRPVVDDEAAGHGGAPYAF